jgi:NAD(P)H-flavin reductase
MRHDQPLIPERGWIRNIIPLSTDNHLFQIKLDGATQITGALPGQFVQLWIPGSGECPISICSGRIDGMLELCVRRAGRVTDALFKMQEGDWLGLRGPYGKGFPIDSFQGKDLVLLAGGLGVAPIRSLWEYILDHREQFGKLILIYGMRHSTDLLFKGEMKILLRRHDIDVFIAAEELPGPELPPVTVQLGRVTDMIKIADVGSSFCAAVCGPPVMYPYVIKELMNKGLHSFNIWLSLERHMKCAIGKCGHCFIGGCLTCKAGPVFCLDSLPLCHILYKT